MNKHLSFFVVASLLILLPLSRAGSLSPNQETGLAATSNPAPESTTAPTAQGTASADESGGAPPVTIVVFREADTLTLYVADKDVVSLDRLTLEATTVDGTRLKARLDEFPALRGLDMTRIVGPACFQLISNQRTSSLPLECRQIPPSHLITQRLTPANMIWFDSVAQEPRLVFITDGTNSYGQCPAAEAQCEIPYIAPARVEPTPTSAATTESVIPLTGQAVVTKKTTFRTGPGPQYDVLATVSAGTYAITGKTPDGSYYRLDYNGQDAWVTAFAQTVTFSVAEAPPQTQPAAGSVPLDATLTYNVPVDGKLDPNKRTDYRFIGIAGETISIVVEGQFSSLLDLYDPKNNLLMEDSNSGENGNPRIDNLKLPRNGEYHVVLRGYTANDSGTFRLTVYKGSAPAVKAGNVIKYSQKITNYFAPNSQAVLVFDGQKGDVISIVVQANFSCYIQLQDSAKNVVTSDDGSGIAGNPLIDLFELPATGEYRIVLYGVNPDDAGTYSITLLKSVADSMVAVKPGVPVASVLQRGNQVVFSFDASAGDKVTVTVDGKFNVHLSLRDERGAELAADGDASSQGGLMEVELPDKGTYYIVVTGPTSSEQGTFTLTMTKR